MHFNGEHSINKESNVREHHVPQNYVNAICIQIIAMYIHLAYAVLVLRKLTK